MHRPGALSAVWTRFLVESQNRVGSIAFPLAIILPLMRYELAETSY